MKTLYNLALAMIVVAACSACGNTTSTGADASAYKETINETPTVTAVSARFASLSFKMDGVFVKGTEPGVMAMYVPAKKEVNIRGNTPQGVMAVIIDNVNGPGTFTIKGNSKNGAGIMMKTKMYEVKKTGTPFTVTIDAVEDITAIQAPGAKAIRGTFQGKLKDDAGNTVEITEGKFSTQ